LIFTALTPLFDVVYSFIHIRMKRVFHNLVNYEAQTLLRLDVCRHWHMITLN
jgi:hypothetical protein